MTDPLPPPTDSRTLSLTESTRVKLPLLFLLVLVSATASSTFIWATQLAASDRQIERTAAHAEIIGDHEKRLKELERASASVEVIKADIRWIREELQRQRRESPR
ncbi:MAG: hypothetical protein Q8M02_14665 [Candidatus Didemnitutus sp.]|nr:hypothetical protein [Candidatus Didemnitutus sp.]